MAVDLTSFLDVLEDSYTAYYNICKEDLPGDLPLVFRADFFQRGEKYWLTKSIPMWGNETNEYCYVFSQDRFDGETVAKCIQYALDDGLARVKPHKEHQYSNVKTVFMANGFDKDCLSDIKNRKFQKSYNHSLWGYSNLLTCAVDVTDESVTTNLAGHDMKKYFKKLFSAQHK